MSDTTDNTATDTSTADNATQGAQDNVFQGSENTNLGQSVPDLLNLNSGAGEEQQPQAQQAQQPAPDLLNTGTASFQFEQPRGQQIDQDQHAGFAAFTNQLAHRAGITDQKVAQAVYESLATQSLQHQEQVAQHFKQVQEQYDTALEREHGVAGAGKLREQANIYLHTNGGEAFAKVLNESGLSRHPEVIAFLAKLAPSPEPTPGAQQATSAPKNLTEAILQGGDAWEQYKQSQRGK